MSHLRGSDIDELDCLKIASGRLSQVAWQQAAGSVWYHISLFDSADYWRAVSAPADFDRSTPTWNIRFLSAMCRTIQPTQHSCQYAAGQIAARDRRFFEYRQILATSQVKAAAQPELSHSSKQLRDIDAAHRARHARSTLLQNGTWAMPRHPKVKPREVRGVLKAELRGHPNGRSIRVQE